MGAATLDQVLEVLRAKRPEALMLGLELIGVVGSVARGEARPDSDVDIIVHHTGLALPFSRLYDFEQRLATVFDRPVDLVFSEIMNPERRTYIERDLVPL